MIDVVARETAAGVGQDFIRHPGAVRELDCSVCGSLACCKYQFCCLDEVADLGADMLSLCDVVDISYQRCLRRDDLRNSSLAAGVGMSVEVCEHQSQIACVLHYVRMIETVEEDSLLRYEYIVENCQGLVVAVLVEGSLKVFSLVVLSGKRHDLDARPVSGKREGDRIALVAPAHELGGVRDDLIDVRCAGVADLGAAYDDALAGLAVDADSVDVCLDDMQEHIRIGLLVRSLILGVAASLDVCLCAVADQVILLAILEIFNKSVIVFGSGRLVAVIGSDCDRVQSVRSHAALHAAAHMVADQPCHQLFLQEVILGLMDVCAAVDDLARHV